MGCFSIFNINRCLPNRTTQSTDHRWEKSVSLTYVPKRFSYRDMKFATDNFSEQRKLGEFGPAVIYRGILKDKTRVVVRRYRESGLSAESFIMEAKTTGSIHHFNVVKLIGFCTENNLRVLVYEFMSSGPLEKWIFNGNTLAWSKRKKIILHTAKGLSYLHEDCHKKIIHANVIPHNIFLDAEFNAKLGDFGFVKLRDKDGESSTDNSIKGTARHLAPECLSGKGNVTEKIDVYSFGVLMLEVMFQRPNWTYSTTHQEEEKQQKSTLIGFVRAKFEEDRLFEAVEECCGEEKEMKNDSEEVEKMIKLAIWCLENDPTTRPSMSRVVNILEGAVQIPVFESPPIMGSSFAQHLKSDPNSFLSESSYDSSATLDMSSIHAPR